MEKNKLVKLSADPCVISRILDYKVDTSDYDPKSISVVDRKKYMIYDYINNNMTCDQIKEKYGVFNKTEIDYLKSLVKVHGYEVFDVTSNEIMTKIQHLLEQLKQKSSFSYDIALDQYKLLKNTKASEQAFKDFEKDLEGALKMFL